MSNFSLDVSTARLNFTVCVVSAWIVLRQRPWQNLAQAYGFFNLSIAAWSACFFIWQLMPTAQAALWPARWVLFLGMWPNQTFLNFVFTLAGMNRKRKAILTGSIALNLVFAALDFTGILFPSVEQRYGLGFWGNATPWLAIYVVFWHAQCLYGFVELIRAFRTSTGRRREQMYYFLTGLGLGYLGGCSSWPLWFKIYVPPHLNILVGICISFLAYAIVKHRLLDIAILVRRTLVYSLITAVLTAIYFVVIKVIADISSGMWGHQTLLSSAIAGGLISALFLPLLRHVQALIDRLFSRLRVDRENKLMEFSTEMVQFDHLNTMTEALYRIITEAIRPKHMALYLQMDGGPQYTEVWGKMRERFPQVMPPENPWERHFMQTRDSIVTREIECSEELHKEMINSAVCAAVRLLSRGELLGYLLLGEKLSEEPYSHEDFVLLKILANQATVAYERPKLLRAVSSGFVHEIKMPLANIALPAELTDIDLQEVERGLKSMDALIPKIRRRMKFIMDQVFLASRRLEAMQEFAGAREGKRQPVPVSALIDKSLAAAREILEHDRVKVQVNIPDGMPDVQGIPEQLEVVFTNLFKNAAEAMEDLPERAARLLEITARLDGNQVMIEVSDTGPGITTGQEELIFQPHFTTKGSKGTGMGLYLARRIIRSHAGDIEVRNKPKSEPGAVFSVHLSH